MRIEWKEVERLEMSGLMWVDYGIWEGKREREEKVNDGMWLMEVKGRMIIIKKGRKEKKRNE